MFRATSRISAMSAVAMGAALAIGSLGMASPSAQSTSNGMKVEGTWMVTVTLRNCATDAVLGTVNSLVTFNRGGTLHETPGGVNFAPGQRSDGHGVWRHKGGHTYSQRFVALIRFDTAPGPGGPGFFEGWQVVSHTLTLSDPDTLSSSGTNEFYDENGQLYRSGCSTAVGKRFQ